MSLLNWQTVLDSGLILPINKPKGYTSFQVVKELRRYVGKLKIGHAGTLDPLASGLLIIAIGKKTKTIDEIQAQPKSYQAVICLGATRPSYDKETEIDKTFDTLHINDELLANASKQFIGEISQTPPVFSAIKIDGKRAYNYAREGSAVEMKPRKQTITKFEIISCNMPLVTVDIDCNKGTYIRSLANDFGFALKSGAYLDDLVRTAIGNYTLNSAYGLEEAKQLLITLQSGYVSN